MTDEIVKAATNGDIAYFEEVTHQDDLQKALYYASKANQELLIQYLVDRCWHYRNVFRGAAAGGHFHLFKLYIRDTDYAGHISYAFGLACQHNQTELVELMIPKVRSVANGVLEAAKAGNLILLCRLLQFVHEYYDYGSLLCCAMDNGKLEIIEYLVSLNIPIDPECIQRACLNGHMNVVEWLMNRNVHISIEAFADACLHGHFELVKRIIEYVESRTTRHLHYYYDEGIVSACIYGYLDIIRYLHEEKGGNLLSGMMLGIGADHVVAYFLDHGIRYTEYIHRSRPYDVYMLCEKRESREYLLSIDQSLREYIETLESLRKSLYVLPIDDRLIDTIMTYYGGHSHT